MGRDRERQRTGKRDGQTVTERIRAIQRDRHTAVEEKVCNIFSPAKHTGWIKWSWNCFDFSGAAIFKQ